MSLNISVLFPSGHRRNAKVSPNSTISQALVDVCKKEALDGEKYSFLFQRKILDETLSWRYANVPNNAKLELIEHEKTATETPVRIALQYEGGQRLQGSFPPSNTLMDILKHWKDELSTLTPPEGEEPSILYLRQEISGNVKLARTTLKSLGLTGGSAILRMSFKPAPKPEEPLKKVIEKKITQKHQREPVLKVDGAMALPKQYNQVIITQKMLQDALQQVSGFGPGEKMDVDPQSSSNFKAVDASAASSSKNGRVRARRPNSSDTMPTKKIRQTPPSSPKQRQPDFSNFKFPEETAGMDIYSAEDDADIDITSLTEPCDREAVFFDEKEVANRDVDSEDPGDEFFELTTDDIRKMIAELRALQTESEDKPLMTSRSRELHRLRSINQYPKIIIRIAFPNRKVLQGIFRPAETIDTLYTFVRKFLSLGEIDFHLYSTPPKVVLKDKQSILYDNHLSPASKVYFGLKNGDFDDGMMSEQCEILKVSAADANLKLGSVFEMKSPTRMQEERSFDFVQSSSQAGPSRSAPSTSHEETMPQQTASDQNTRSHPSGARPKVPKWFKIGR